MNGRPLPTPTDNQELIVRTHHGTTYREGVKSAAGGSRGASGMISGSVSPAAGSRLLYEYPSAMSSMQRSQLDSRQSAAERMSRASAYGQFAALQASPKAKSLAEGSSS